MKRSLVEDIATLDMSCVCVSVRYPRAHNPGILTTHWKQPEWKQVCGYKFKRILSFFHWECRQRWYISLTTSFSCRLVPTSDWGSSTSSVLDSPWGSWDLAPYLQYTESLISKQLESSLSNWAGRLQIPDPEDTQVPYIKGQGVCITPTHVLLHIQ